MPQLSSSRRSRGPRRRLVALLDRAAADLSELEFYAECLRAQEGAPSGFSRAELAALMSTADRGRRAIMNRLRELRPDGDVREIDVAMRQAESPPNASTPASLIITYKRCSRRLGLAWQEAREATDSASGESIYRLLRDMEKQLWLICPPRQTRPRFSPLLLFQTC